MWREICLLVLAGLLWGCTNPLIRNGARGLRKVTARNKTTQIWEEFKFLVYNWQYMAPFAVNQLGSVCYWLAVQSAPLSVAVPTANGLAFAITALVGSFVGTEEPLDTASLLGIGVIVGGTALCCWDSK